jgi:hypothetical protein
MANITHILRVDMDLVSDALDDATLGEGSFQERLEDNINDSLMKDFRETLEHLKKDKKLAETEIWDKLESTLRRVYEDAADARKQLIPIALQTMDIDQKIGLSTLTAAQKVQLAERGELLIMNARDSKNREIWEKEVNQVQFLQWKE